MQQMSQDQIVKAIENFIIENKGIPGMYQVSFGHVPPRQRLELFQNIPLEVFDSDLVTLFMSTCGEAGEVQTAIKFANYFLDNGVISKFQYGGIQAIVESPYRRAEGQYKTFDKAISRLQFENDPFSKLLLHYCQHYKAKGEK
ncbi:hypothetical protein [Paenibacillus sp. YYML68]|uniref:hypothetical protein n=1 Tax=Paenibacillus sp. YYML68 TaxID=2909250 RepID=UPI0024929051|nr:hypothetical protein [Paenibacillus sp. YYML68]